MLRRRDSTSRRLALGIITLMVFVSCATRYKTPRASTKVTKALVGDTTHPQGAGISTLEQLRSIFSDSTSSDSLSLVGKEKATLRNDSLTQTIDTLPDSLQQGKVLDSLSQAKADADSLEKVRKRRAAETFDDIIAYKAQDSMVLLGQNLTYLFGPSTVDYKDKGLEANFMRMNTDSSLVYAHYTIDSAGKATAYPKFKDGGESYEAKSLNYNFKTSKGFITGAVTQQGEGYITAERTKLMDNNCLYMENGRYSTCDNHEHPHFYFMLTKGKARPQKNVVAGPSYLVIADVPTPIGLPFGFFPFN